MLICNLELEVIADIGFIGKPSASKSTIISVISKAKPKIANYDFTTLEPQLGLVRLSKNKSFVAIDLPGLMARDWVKNEVEKNTLNVIFKWRAIAYILDFEDLKNDLKNFRIKLMSLPFVIVANKMDRPYFFNHLKKFKKINPNLEIIRISALMKKNISDLKYRIFHLLNCKFRLRTA